MWQERVSTDCSILRVLAAIAGAEGVVEGLALIVLSCISITMAGHYRGIAQDHLSPQEMDLYLRVYSIEVTVSALCIISFGASAAINATLFGGAFLADQNMVLRAYFGYVCLYSWLLPLALLAGVLWTIGGVYGYPGLALVYICLLKMAFWWALWRYTKQLKKAEVEDEKHRLSQHTVNLIQAGYMDRL